MLQLTVNLSVMLYQDFYLLHQIFLNYIKNLLKHYYRFLPYLNMLKYIMDLSLMPNQKF